MAFGAASERLAFILSLDASGAIQGFRNVGDTAERELGKADQRLDRLGSRMQGIGAGMLASAGLAGRALFGMAQASEEANLSVVKLQNSIDRSPELAGESVDRFTDLAESIQSVTAADGDAIVAAEAMLGTFHLTGDEIESITPLVVDYARKFGVDLVTAATQVGKALDGNIGALQRVGININEAAYEADSFGAVMDALRENVGGFAEAEGQTLAGQMERLKNQLGDVAEGMGTGVVSAFNDFFAGPALSFSNFLTETSPGTQNLVGRVATIGTAAVGAAGGISLLAGSAIKMRDRFTDATGSLNNFGRAAQFAGVAAAAAIVVAGIQSIDDEAERLAATFERDVRRNLFDSNQAWSEFGDNMSEIDAAILDLEDDLSRNPFDIDKNHQIRLGVEALKGLKGEVNDTGLEIIALSDAEGISLDVATQRVLATKNQADVQAVLAEAVGEETAAVLLNAGAVDESNAAHARAKEQIDRNRRAYEALSDARQAALGLEISEERAQLNRMRAEQRLAEVRADPEATAIEIRDAELSVLESHLAVGEAAAERAEAEAIAAGRASTAVQEGAQAQIESLLSVAQQLDPGSELRRRLDEYIWQIAWLEQHPEINTRVVLTVEERQAQQDAGRQQATGQAGRAGAGTVNNINVNVESTANPDEIGRSIAWHVN